MAKKQDLKMRSLTRGCDACQPPSCNDTQRIVESEELSALSSVETKGSSNLADVQSKGMSDSCSVESPLVNNAAIAADEDLEHALGSTDSQTVECQQYSECERDGQIPSTSGQSVQEHLGVAQETVDNETPSDTNCLHYSIESDLLNTEDVSASVELSTQDAVSDIAAVGDQIAVEECLVSDGQPDDHLGELLSCADCGASGLYFLLITWGGR